MKHFTDEFTRLRSEGWVVDERHYENAIALIAEEFGVRPLYRWES